MDYRLISTLDTQPGWKAMSHYINTRIKEIEKDLVNFNGIHSEPGRLRFGQLQGERESLLLLTQIVEDPKRVSHYFESDLPSW